MRRNDYQHVCVLVSRREGGAAEKQLFVTQKETVTLIEENSSSLKVSRS